jgi:translocation and assembly module TamA
MRRRPNVPAGFPPKGRSLAWLLAPIGVVALSPVHAQSGEAPEDATVPVMAPMPDIDLAWPDLDAEEPPLPDMNAPSDPAEIVEAVVLENAADDGEQSQQVEAPLEGDGGSALLATLDPSEPLRYAHALQGLGEAADETLLTRFDALSVLKAGEGEPANVAQIRRRGRADAQLLDDLLRARGYYDSRTSLDFRQGSGVNRVLALLAANPGDVYRIGNVDVDGLTDDDPRTADIRKLFTVKVGDHADTDAINGATDALRIGLLDGGYPFSDVRDPVLVIDHGRQSATLNMTVSTGGYRRIGNVTVNPDAPFDARHVDIISRFSAGDPYRQSDIADLNSALVATGLVSQVSITPHPGTNDETVDLDLVLSKAPPRTVAGELGYGTGEGLRAEVSWQHRNLLPPEGAVTVRAVAAEQEQSLSATFRRANFGARDRVLNGEISFANLDQPAYQARIAGISGSVELQTNLIFQKDWTWSAGAEIRVSDERDLYGTDLTPRRRIYLVAALPSGLNYDDSDDLLDPRKGFRLGGRISPELSLQGRAFGYVRAQVDGSFYLPAGDRLTIAGRARVGTIVGASHDSIAPTRRFYAGGGASVRGFSYQAIGPRDANNDPIGGRSLGEFSLEARFRFGALQQFGIVPFIDAGTISPEPLPGLSEMRVGAGLGFRYYSNFGPIRIDVGTPINPQPGDSRIGVYVSLGQAF